MPFELVEQMHQGDLIMTRSGRDLKIRSWNLLFLISAVTCVFTAGLVPTHAEPVASQGLPPSQTIVIASSSLQAPGDVIHLTIAQDSPQATMMTFLKLVTADVPADPVQATALHTAIMNCFDLSRIDADIPTQRELAKMLLSLLDRIGTVEPGQLPDAAQVQTQKLQIFRYFPKHPNHDWVWKDVEGGPRGEIALNLQSDGQWRFTAQTVKDLPQLYASMIKLPKRHQTVNHLGELVGPTWQRTTWQGWLKLFGAILAGVILGKLGASVFQNVANRLESRNWRTRATIFRNAASPFSLGIVGLGLAIGLQFIHLESDLSLLGLRIIKFLYILAFGWFLYNLVDIIDLWLRTLTAKTESKLDDMLVPLVRKALRIFLVVVFTLVVAQNVFGLDITAWLAGLSIAGLAVSFAAQDSIKNLFGSITVFFDQPFVVGDAIVFEGQDAVVEEIGFRSTRLRNPDGHLVTVPNMKFIDGSVRNISRRPSIRRVVNVTITYDTSVDKLQQAMDIINSILAKPDMSQPFDMQAQPPRIYLTELNKDHINIQVIYWYQLQNGRDGWSYFAHAQTFNLQLLQAFSAAGIDMAFPTQTLYLAGDPKHKLAVTSG